MPGLNLKFWQGRQVPLLLQTEAAECGLACLGMVASFHGHHCDLASLRQSHSISLKGTTLAHLINIASDLKLNSRAVRADLNQLPALHLPAILHWDFSHFVVLAAIEKQHVVLHDPAIGQRRLALSEVSKHYTGVALEVLPAEDFQPRVQRQRLSLGRLIGKPPGVNRAVLQIFLLAGALEVFAMLSPFYMQLVVDQALVSQDSDLLTVLAYGFLMAAIIHVALTALRSWAVMVLGTCVNVQLMTKLFRHLLTLPMSFFVKRHLGDVVSRFESINVIQRTLTGSAIEAIVDGMMALVTLLMMFVYSWKLALLVCIAAVAYTAVRLSLYRPLRRATEEQILRLAKQQSNFLETVRGVQSVKLFNRQAQRKAQYQNLLVDSFNAGIRIQKLQILYKLLNGSLFGIENIAVVWWGAKLVLSNSFSIGMLFAFMSYKEQFTSRIIGLIEKSIEFWMLGLHTERVADIALTAPEVENPAANVALCNDMAADIDVKGLSFRYADAEPYVLEGLDLNIRAGESVAIVGGSGCGKTTLLKLLLGLLSPSTGEITVGGIPLSRIDPQHYRRRIGTVMQDDQLFAGSIADNICFFDDHPNHQHIEVCAELACIHSDIRKMPMGYNTLIGDMGTVLSGGQKQRVLLARALYKRPSFLFLDEATSHLDVLRERRVNEAIKQLKLTRIIVAHRPETIASVDRVIVLGTHADEAKPLTALLPTKEMA